MIFFFRGLACKNFSLATIGSNQGIDPTANGRLHLMCQGLSKNKRRLFRQVPAEKIVGTKSMRGIGLRLPKAEKIISMSKKIWSNLSNCSQVIDSPADKKVSPKKHRDSDVRILRVSLRFYHDLPARSASFIRRKGFFQSSMDWIQMLLIIWV